MNLLNYIKSFFVRLSVEPDGLAEKESSKLNQESKKNEEFYALKRIADIEKVSEKYGPDFYGFLYRQDTDGFIRKEVLSFLDPESKYNHFLDNNHWDSKNPYNFPGPFYSGESDTCGTGHIEAPGNVNYDADACEYIFKQPQNFAEFIGVVDAAAVEVLDSYSCNGNNYWTYEKCKDWWLCKDRLLVELDMPEIRRVNDNWTQLYIDYLNGDAEMDLRKYCYFLENGVYPVNGTEVLPEL